MRVAQKGKDRDKHEVINVIKLNEKNGSGHFKHFMLPM